MPDLVPWYSVEQEPGRESARGYCHYALMHEAGATKCGHRTKKMGSMDKAESAIKDHLRDVHQVDL